MQGIGVMIYSATIKLSSPFTLSIVGLFLPWLSFKIDVLSFMTCYNLMLQQTDTELYSYVISNRNITANMESYFPMIGRYMQDNQSCLLHTQMMVRRTFVIDSISIWKLLRQISVTTKITRINPDICTLFLMFLSCCVLTFHFLILMFTAVTVVDSGISTCLMLDCLSTNIAIPTIINKKCITDFREKMIHSLQTKSIETGLQRLTVEPTRAPPTERRLAP